jgi:hypothetical protein
MALLTLCLLTLSGDSIGLTLEPGGSALGCLRVTSLGNHPTDAITPGPATPPQLLGARLETRLRGETGSDRFVLKAELGSGASSHVWSAIDNNLRRDVVVKVLRYNLEQSPDDVGSFFAEARLTAALRHPGILPVHDLDIAGDGRPYFTMPRLDGWTLAEVIYASTTAQRDQRLPDIHAVVQVFINAAHAIGYAHHRGVVHQDIKPDNLLLGAFGEVLVLDWGAALSSAGQHPGQPFQGTPLYMAPEQARMESVDARSDQFSFGASLFHALVLRPPTKSAGLEASLARRRAGELDPPSEAERARVPAALLAITARALEADPAARYASIGHLRADLEAWQAGQAVSVFVDPWRLRLRRWHRRHGRRLWTGVAMTAVVLVLAGMLWGERLKDRAVWGAPVVAERFDDPSWRQRWIEVGGAFSERGGRLVSTGTEGSSMLLRQRLDGPVAIEFIGEFPPGAQPGDLSAWWRPNLPEGAPAASLLGGEVYRFLVGAYDNAFCSIVGPKDTYLASREFHLVAGHRYRIRAEIDGRRLSLHVDGELMAEWIAPLPLSGGHLGLIAWYPDKRFSDIKIFSRGTAERLSAIAIGDAFAQEGLWPAAAREYARVAASHPDGELGREAQFRQGLAELRSGDRHGAEAVWQGLAGTAWADQAVIERLDADFQAGSRGELLASLESLLRRAGPALRREAAMRWVSWMGRFDSPLERFAQAPAFLALRDRYLADEKFTEKIAAEVLLRTYRNGEIEGRYPRQRTTIAWALLDSGRPTEVIARYPDQFTVVQHAYRQLAWYGSISGDLRLEIAARSRIEQGQAEAIAANPIVNANMRARAFLVLGRLEDAERTDPASDSGAWARWARGIPGAWEPYSQRMAAFGTGLVDEQAIADLTLGRLDEAERVMRRQGVPWCLQWLAQRRRLEAWIAGDHTTPFPATDAGHLEYDRIDAAFALRFMPAVLAALNGNRTVVATAASDVAKTHAGKAGGRLLHLVRFATAAEDEATFLAQPCRLDVDRLLIVAKALRAELAGDSATAQSFWSAYVSQPAWKRGIDAAPCLDRLAEWRLRGR